MALELHEQVAAALLDALHAGWAKRLELEGGDRVRTSWQSGDDGDEWLRVENEETGHVRDFLVNIKCVDLGAPSGDECLNCAPYVDQASSSRVDGSEPWEACRDCGVVLAEKPETVERTWAQVCAGDAAQGGDGVFYPVVRQAMGRGPNEGFAVVTLLIGGEERVYNMHPMGVVQVIRGEAGMRMDVLSIAGLGAEVIKS